MVRSGSIPHVLSAVKHEEFPQDELNAALHEAAWKGDLQVNIFLLLTAPPPPPPLLSLSLSLYFWGGRGGC